VRKLTAISLLLLFWAPLIGAFTVFQFQKYQHRKAVKWQIIRGMQREHLTLLKFSKEEHKRKLIWKDEHEFEYQGCMYDLVEHTISGDTIQIWCRQDHAETALNQKIEQAITQATGQIPPDRQTQEQLLHFLKSLYCSNWPSPESDLLPLPYPAGFPPLPMRYASLSHGPPPPPPWAS
jgi:hypothetical protein